MCLRVFEKLFFENLQKNIVLEIVLGEIFMKNYFKKLLCGLLVLSFLPIDAVVRHGNVSANRSKKHRTIPQASQLVPKGADFSESQTSNLELAHHLLNKFSMCYQHKEKTAQNLMKNFLPTKSVSATYSLQNSLKDKAGQCVQYLFYVLCVQASGQTIEKNNSNSIYMLLQPENKERLQFLQLIKKNVSEMTMQKISPCLRGSIFNTSDIRSRLDLGVWEALEKIFCGMYQNISFDIAKGGQRIVFYATFIDQTRQNNGKQEPLWSDQNGCGSNRLRFVVSQVQGMIKLEQINVVPANCFLPDVCAKNGTMQKMVSGNQIAQNFVKSLPLTGGKKSKATRTSQAANFLSCLR